MSATVYGPRGEVWATAPDETWNLRNRPWPEPGVMVDGCWSSRQTTTPKYEVAKVRLVRHDGCMSVWANERGEVLCFNPDFWRPVSPDIRGATR